MTYHYVLVLSFHTGGAGYALAESSGTVDLPDGTSRHEAYQQARSNMIESAGKGPNATTVFWSLEPDTLGGDR